MKIIGMLGGMSWESTVTYYREINEGIKHALGGLHSATIVMNSVNFAPIAQLQSEGNWEEMVKILTQAAQSIESGGADFLLICTNTMHKIAPQVEEAINIPLIHIADATGEAMVKNGVKSVGLLGTAFTMEQEFYKERLKDKYGLNVLIPNDQDRQAVHQIIYQELCLGKIHRESKQEYLRIIDTLADQGAEAIILACTEIGLLVDQSDTSIPLYDTALLHTQKAVEFALSE